MVQSLAAARRQMHTTSAKIRKDMRWEREKGRRKYRDKDVEK
jgi:hypothetical protein